MIALADWPASLVEWRDVSRLEIDINDGHVVPLAPHLNASFKSHP
jgi:hypothetical protein